LKIERRYTAPGKDPLDQVTYEKRASVITNPDGSEVFRMDDAEVPSTWSQLATDIVVSKYFRKRGVPKTGHEVSVRQVVHRVARTIRQAGEDFGGYFDTTEDADAFESELSHHLVNQIGAFNSPVWFNCGLFHEYKIKGSGGSFYWDRRRDKILETKDAYGHPQCSACYIQSVDDDLMKIFDLLKNEARLFKYGSGTGTNFSKIRGNMEMLSGGGTSSGLMSFLEVLDRGAGATKSGGTTRRAAKMVCLDLDHPEIETFINWKRREEKKVAALIAAGYSSDFNGDAYRTVSGQNSNNSVRIPDTFMESYETDGDWETTLRTTGEVHKTYKARDLMNQISEAAWACADPGVQYDSVINRWHTCPETDRINGSNPCSEYMFLDDSACNLASINLTKFLNEDGSFDIEGFRFACKIFILAQEIMVDLASYPTAQIAQNSHDYRPLGLGYTNLGTLLMIKGLPYDSDQGRAICGAITSIMCGHAYATSAEVAASKEPFAGHARNSDSMLKVMNMHRDAAYEINPDNCPAELLAAAQEDWDVAVKLGEKHGYRNSQSTVIAPTGTIGLLMDCDTTGIEPDFALVKFKKLAGGGYFKIVNASVPRALRTLGYTEKQVTDIINYVSGTLTLREAPHINRESLQEKGFTKEALEKVEKALPGVFELSFAFSTWGLGEDTIKALGFKEAEYNTPGFNLLRALGFTRAQVDEANDVICGRMTIEGAPHMADEHLPVFDCANTCGKTGKRYIMPTAHLKMMSAAQKFISGAISKTVNVPHDTLADEIEDLYVEGWKLGLKAVAIYRDGSKLSQPLSSSSSEGEEDDDSAESTDTETTEAIGATVVEAAQPAPTAQLEQVVATAVEEVIPRGSRRRLPPKRTGFTQEAKIAGHKVFLRTGEYEDGSLGEIFIDMHKEGAPFRSMLNCFAIAISKGLQYGVPLEELVEGFTFIRFEPWGSVDHPNVKFATSVIDYVFRVLGYEYLGRTDFLQVKPEEIENSGTGSAAAEAHAAEAEVLAKAKTAEAPKKAADPKAKTDEPTAHTAAAIGDVIPTNGNGGTHVKKNGTPKLVPAAERLTQTATQASVLDSQLSNMMGDAPFCDTCGHITVRNGSCYRCLNCGNSVGCS